MAITNNKLPLLLFSEQFDNFLYVIYLKRDRAQHAVVNKVIQTNELVLNRFFFD